MASKRLKLISRTLDEELDDLINIPAVGDGVGSFLREFPARGPAPAPPEPRPPVQATPRVKDIPGARLPESNPDPGVTVQPGVRLTPGSPLKLAQDAHTVWEQILYDYLWNIGEPTEDGSRIAAAGRATVSSQTRLGDKTVKRNLKYLTEKLAIEPLESENSYSNTGKTFRVFSYGQILERRREAGLTWIVRNRQGVSLSLAPGVTDENWRKLGQGSPGVKVSNADTVTPGPPGQGADVSYRVKSLVKTTSSEADAARFLPDVISLVEQYGVIPEDRPLVKMITASLQAAEQGTGVPATLEELLAFTRAKLDVIVVVNSRVVRIHSPLAYLAGIVPKCFEGESFRSYRRREAERAGREAQARKVELEEVRRWKETQRRVLEDPGASDEAKKDAREFLEGAGD